MDNAMLEKIVLLADIKKVHDDDFNKLMEKGARQLGKLDDAYYEKYGPIKYALRMPAAYMTAIKCINKSRVIAPKRKNLIVEHLGVPAELVALDDAQLKTPNTQFTCFANDLYYDGTIPSESLESIKLIFGDANLQKLHDFSSLTSLEAIIGNLNATTATNSNALENLKVVTGDLHVEQMTDLSFLSGIEYVGGSIYTKEGEKTLSDFKSFQKKYK